MPTLMSRKELDELERKYAPRGISAREVVRVFESRGLRLSEATFRKYVQAGLLPRSRRVGQKGKHRGSVGLYPATVVRRIVTIKSMMAAGSTLEEIRDSYLFVRSELDTMEQALTELRSRLQERIARQVPRGERERLRKELESTHGQAQRVLLRLEKIGSRVVAAGSRASKFDREER